MWRCRSGNHRWVGRTLTNKYAMGKPLFNTGLLQSSLWRGPHKLPYEASSGPMRWTENDRSVSVIAETSARTVSCSGSRLKTAMLAFDVFSGSN